MTNLFGSKSADILRKFRLFYICALTVYTICREVIPLKPIIASNICSLSFFGAGLALIVLTFIIERNYFHVENKNLLIALVGICIISTLVNFRFAFFSNIKAICWICIYLFLVYPAFCKNNNTRKTTLNAICITAVVTMFVFVAISLPMYFNNIGYTYYKIADGITSQGFSSEYLRLWGVFQEANYCAVYACIAILMACYLFKEFKNIVARIALCVVNVLEFAFVVLTGSRTALLVILLIGAWTGFYTVASKLKGMSKIKRASVALGSGAVFAVLFFLVFSAVKTSLPIIKKGVNQIISEDIRNSTHIIYDRIYFIANVDIVDGFSNDFLLYNSTDKSDNESSEIPDSSSVGSLFEDTPSEYTSSDAISSDAVSSDEVSSESTPSDATSSEIISSENVSSEDVSSENVTSGAVSSENNTSEIIPPVGNTSSLGNQYEELSRPDMDKKDDISNGRFRRWIDGMKIFLKSPIVGASPRGITAFAQTYCPDTYIAMYHYSVASTVVEVFAAIGLLGVFIVLLIFIKAIRLVFKKIFESKFDFEFLILSSIVLFLAAASVLQCDLFFNLTFGGVVFWAALGSLFGSDEKFAPKIVKHDRVLVYGLKDPAGGVEKIILDYTKVLSENNVAFDFVFSGSTVSFEEEIINMGGRCFYLPSRIKKHCEYVKALEKLFENNNYSAVWGNYSGLTNIDLLVYAEKFNVPIRIAHSHVAKLYWGSPIAKYLVILLHWINKQRVSSYATNYFACSRKAGEFMFPESVYDQIQVVNNAIDIYKYHPKEGNWDSLKAELGIDKDDIVFGHVARMCTAKNQIFLLDVMKDIVEKKPNSKLLFVGDGELKESIVSHAEAIGINHNVLFLGNRSDVFDLLQIVDVFLLPSLSEGLGISVIEAQACGVPCVVSSAVPRIVNVSGMVEFLDLNSGTKNWADKSIEMVGKRIIDPTKSIIASGYEITSSAEGVMNVLAEARI